MKCSPTSGLCQRLLRLFHYPTSALAFPASSDSLSVSLTYLWPFPGWFGEFLLVSEIFLAVVFPLVFIEKSSAISISGCLVVLTVNFLVPVFDSEVFNFSIWNQHQQDGICQGDTFSVFRRWTKLSTYCSF